MRSRHVLAAVLGMATVPLAGCATQSCTLVGGSPGVVITDAQVLIGLDAVAVTVCVTETACATQPVTTTVDGSLTIETELLSRRVTTVTLSATDVGGAEVFRETKPVTPTVSYPNGKGCDPEVWRATVRL